MMAGTIATAVNVAIHQNMWSNACGSGIARRYGTRMPAERADQSHPSLCSDAQAVMGITTASATMYPVATHWIVGSGPCRSRPSVGSAALTIIGSRCDMNDLMMTTAKGDQYPCVQRSAVWLMRGHMHHRRMSSIRPCSCRAASSS
jgi:hypothetical protein